MKDNVLNYNTINENKIKTNYNNKINDDLLIVD